MNLDLRGKKALVCGSTQGIGKAVALELALLGASVTLVARNEETLRKTRSELSTLFQQQHDYVVADFSQPSELKKVVEKLVASKNIHILVNNTGGPPSGPITEATEEAFLQAFNNHLICNQLLATALFPGMKQEGYGRIINIISTSVKQPLKNLGVSNTVRAAVANWSKTWANEVAHYGITVNNVLPGATNTVRLRSIIEAKATKTGSRIDDVKHEMLEEVPMKRFAEASEIASAVAFLASPAAGYISGVNLPVDGGRTGCL
jgi:3-oxoacyl-[acyl-carrier protein] reductase